MQSRVAVKRILRSGTRQNQGSQSFYVHCKLKGHPFKLKITFRNEWIKIIWFKYPLFISQFDNPKKLWLKNLEGFAYSEISP